MLDTKDSVRRRTSQKLLQCLVSPLATDDARNPYHECDFNCFGFWRLNLPYDLQVPFDCVELLTHSQRLGESFQEVRPSRFG